MKRTVSGIACEIKNKVDDLALGKNISARLNPCLERTSAASATGQSVGSESWPRLIFAAEEDMFYFCSLKRGHCSSTYFSAASRMTQANETFFFFAIPSSVRYRSDGKLIDARTELSPFRTSFLFRSRIMVYNTISNASPHYTTAVKQGNIEIAVCI